MVLDPDTLLHQRIGLRAILIGILILATFGTVAWIKVSGDAWGQIAYAFAPVIVALSVFLFLRSKFNKKPKR